MSEEDLKSVEAFIRDLLKTSPTTLTADQLFSAGREQGDMYSPDVMRRAIWRSVSAGRLAFDADWTLRVA